MKIRVVIVLAVLSLGAWLIRAAEESRGSSPATPVFAKLGDARWEKILPDLGPASPEICILRVDPATQATQLLVRSTRGIHIRKHWHTANEVHMLIKGTATLACGDNKAELTPGGYNYMPAKMQHEAWLSADSLTFITVDSAWDIHWVEGAPTASDLMEDR
jgi:mannose-6-phosphate isomerase-like protein (cupin superfamily)